MSTKAMGWIRSKTKNEKELTKAIRKEQRLGLSALPKETIGDMFTTKDMHTEAYTLEEKKK